MEYTDIEYIRIGIWSSGIIFTLLLTSLLAKTFYRAVIRPWRRIAPLTMADLKNRRKYKNLKESYLMKPIKAAIWISGIIFAILMVWGIALTIRYNFQGAPIKKQFIKLLNTANAENAAKLTDVEQMLSRLGTTKAELLRELKAEIARIEQESGGAPAGNAALVADYKSLCLLRDILEGKTTSTEALTINSDIPGDKYQKKEKSNSPTKTY